MFRTTFFPWPSVLFSPSHPCFPPSLPPSLPPLSLNALLSHWPNRCLTPVSPTTDEPEPPITVRRRRHFPRSTALSAGGVQVVVVGFNVFSRVCVSFPGTRKHAPSKKKKNGSEGGSAPMGYPRCVRVWCVVCLGWARRKTGGREGGREGTIQPTDQRTNPQPTTLHSSGVSILDFPPLQWIFPPPPRPSGPQRRKRGVVPGAPVLPPRDLIGTREGEGGRGERRGAF